MKACSGLCELGLVSPRLDKRHKYHMKASARTKKKTNPKQKESKSLTGSKSEPEIYANVYILTQRRIDLDGGLVFFFRYLNSKEYILR